MENFIKLFERVLLPLIVIVMPFTPNIYGWLTAPDYHYVFEEEYDKNPVHVWDLQIGRLVEQIETYGADRLEEPPKALLKEIGSEIYNSLPAMLAGIGFKPFDSKKVIIANLTNHKDLHNIKVTFIGCVGFDSFETYPDKFGSIDNKDKTNTDTVTIQYPKLSASPHGYIRNAYITYYGADTSNCEADVDIELNDGTTARGKKVLDTNEYIKDQYATESKYESLGEFLFKFIVIAILLVFYYRSRHATHR